MTDVMCGQAAQWPADDLRCVLPAGHADAHKAWTEEGKLLVYPDRPCFGQPEPKVAVKARMHGREEAYGADDVRVELENAQQRIVVAMDGKRLAVTVDVEGTSTLVYES